jgi:class 3 adenylate cyclase
VGEAACALTVPRAVLGRVQVLAAPAVDDAAFASRRARDRAWLLHANLAMMLTFVVFSATMVATERRDPVARWSLASGALYLLRLVVTNRGALFALGGGGTLDALPWWRVEYAGLWVFTVAFLRYGEELGGRRAVGRGPLVAALAAMTALACFASYSSNRAALPIGQLAALASVAAALHVLFRVPATRAIGLARAGVAVVLLAAFGASATVALVGDSSPLLEALGSTEPFFQMAVLAVRAQEARKKSAALARATQHFVPKQFLQELGHEDVSTAKLGDAASRHVTVLFADIRNFTAVSERMTPAETFAFLNACLSRIGPHVRGNGGFVDKYIGDAIMALFPRNPADAVLAAIAMQREIAASNARHPGRAPLAIGVGLHAGEVMMGTIGEAERFEATVISDAVNLTARLESLTKQLGCSVLLSGAVFAALPDDLRAHTRPLGRFVVKGRAGAVELFECYASEPEAVRFAKDSTRERFAELLAAYAEGKLERAAALAGELRDAHPEDGPAGWWFLRTLQALRDDDGATNTVPSERGAVVIDAK